MGHGQVFVCDWWWLMNVSFIVVCEPSTSCIVRCSRVKPRTGELRMRLDWKMSPLVQLLCVALFAIDSQSINRLNQINIQSRAERVSQEFSCILYSGTGSVFLARVKVMRHEALLFFRLQSNISPRSRTFLQRSGKCPLSRRTDLHSSVQGESQSHFLSITAQRWCKCNLFVSIHLFFGLAVGNCS